MRAPGGRKFGPKRQHGQQPRRGHLVQKEREQFQRGRIGPMQIFPGIAPPPAALLLHTARPQALRGSSLSVSAGSGSGAEPPDGARRTGRPTAVAYLPAGSDDALRACWSLSSLSSGESSRAKLQEPLQVLNDGVEAHCSADRANSATPGSVRPSCSTVSLSASTNRDLPMPGSPLSSTICPAPSFTRSQRSRNRPYSWSRPTSGVSPLRATT